MLVPLLNRNKVRDRDCDMNNHISIYWCTPRISSLGRTRSLMYHNRTPHLGLLILLHPAASINHTQPAGRGVVPHKQAHNVPLPIACFAILLYNFLLSFFWNPCMYNPPRSHLLSCTHHHQHHRCLCIISVFLLSFLVPLFPGFRLSFSQLQLIDSTCHGIIHKDRNPFHFGAYYCMLAMYIVARIQAACFCMNGSFACLIGTRIKMTFGF